MFIVFIIFVEVQFIFAGIQIETLLIVEKSEVWEQEIKGKYHNRLVM